MNNEKPPTKPPSFPQRGKKYSALFDLQDFLEKEVQDATPGTFYRSFVPLTDGLGLESPKHASTPQETAPPPPPVGRQTSRPAPRVEKRVDINQLFNEEIFKDLGEDIPKVSDILNAQKATQSKATGEAPATSGVPVSAILESMVPKAIGHEANLKSVISPEVTETKRPTKKEVPFLEPVATENSAEVKGQKNIQPPKLPTVNATKRLLSFIVDQIFVLTLWALAIVITSNLQNGFSTGFTMAVLNDFSNPVFQRFAILEFSAIWLTYLAISVGILDLTFGLWVWGLRVSYGSPSDSQYWMRKMMRVIWSFFFLAPIVPSFLLMFRRKGRNLLDVLSGTNLYVAG